MEGCCGSLLEAVKNVDTIGFSRVVLQLQPKRKLTMIPPDTTGFSRVVRQLQPK
jgi:hypothetical protein